MTLLESMSYGNCCLISDIPENTEVVENYALSFRKGETGDLKEKLQYLLEKEVVVKEFKEKSSEFICKKYNWDNVVNQTIQAYLGNAGKDK